MSGSVVADAPRPRYRVLRLLVIVLVLGGLAAIVFAIWSAFSYLRFLAELSSGLGGFPSGVSGPSFLTDSLLIPALGSTVVGAAAGLALFGVAGMLRVLIDIATSLRLAAHVSNPPTLPPASPTQP